jgi:hypothetical protein
LKSSSGLQTTPSFFIFLGPLVFPAAAPSLMSIVPWPTSYRERDTVGRAAPLARTNRDPVHTERTELDRKHVG